MENRGSVLSGEDWSREESAERRQARVTWALVAFALVGSMGMAEWSKRSAMGERVVSPQVLERALAIAEKMEDRRSQMGNHPSSISQTSSPLRSDSEANIPTSAGAER